MNMTIQEMARIYKRICNIYEDDYCNGCPLLPLNFGDGSADDCLNAMIQFPDEFEQELLKWAKENPAPTNRDKFFEVFGNPDYKNSDCQALDNTCTKMPCYDCDWWDLKYVEPEKEGE